MLACLLHFNHFFKRDMKIGKSIQFNVNCHKIQVQGWQTRCINKFKLRPACGLTMEKKL